MGRTTDFVSHGSSWQPGLPDYRDYGPDHAVVSSLLTRLKRLPKRAARRRAVDLRHYFPPPVDQQNLRSASAHAAVALIEYFQRRARGDTTAGSVHFVYKMARKLLYREGNVGCDLRTVFKAIVRFGIPPAYLCPDNPSCFDDEPEPFLYSYADRYRKLVYLRLDLSNTRGSETLQRMKSFLNGGFPFVLGFSLPESMTSEPDIPWQPMHDAVRGGHALVAVGYDDQRIRSTKGALLVRNSWGPTWGNNGYGWLPYRYVERQIVCDCWTVLQDAWMDREEFRRPEEF